LIYHLDEVTDSPAFDVTETTTAAEPDVAAHEADDTSQQTSYRYHDRSRTQADSHSHSRSRVMASRGRGGAGVADTGARTISLAEYSLPTERTLKNRAPVTQAEIAKEFALLDIEGDGKLTFLRLKSALELMLGSNDRHMDGNFRGTDHDDVLIRSWLRENDPDVKGYVDWDDFLAIYTRAHRVVHASSSARYPLPAEGAGGVSFRIKGASTTASARRDAFESEGDSNTAVRMMKLRK
jgi:hypothetical protein